MNRKRKEFLGLAAPVGYVSGMGRGATGFTTRSDIGPARDDTDVPDERHSQFKKSKDDDEGENLNDSNYDEFSGYGGNLCSKDPYDEEDKEADIIYDQIDKHMDERRRAYREIRELKEIEKFRQKRPKIQQLFVDVKRDLAGVSFDEWKHIPEVGDARNKKQRNPRPEMQLPIPDSLIQKSFADNKAPVLDGSITPGIQTPSGDIDMMRIGRARTKLMDNRLNQVSDSLTGQTNVDPKGYITDMNSIQPQIIGDNARVEDVKATREMLQNMVKTDPTNPSAWIAYTRYEENFNKINEAKQSVMKGCENCPENEELWLDAVRIMGQYSGRDNMKNARAVVRKAIGKIPDSIKLWIKAADLEETAKNKKLTLREALKEIPDSVRLWKCAVELEDEEDDAKLMLQGAVKCCPNNVEFWLALARLCPPDEARSVLNKARQTVPTDRQIWITAFKLEETAGNEDRIPVLVARAVETLSKTMVEINREEWLRDAQDAEQSGHPITARRIVQHVVGLGIEPQDRKHTWLADAEASEALGCYECARAVYSVATEQLTAKKSVWRRAAQFEKTRGTRESYEECLRRAVRTCPRAEVLWLMLAKSRWEAGAVDDARMELNSAFTANPNSEEIMLAAMKLESETNQFTRARKLLQKALNQVDTPRVWMKCARLEWCLEDLASARSLLERATGKYPVGHPKLWMMLGQVLEQSGDGQTAVRLLSEGLDKNPRSVELCTLLANIEQRLYEGDPSRARRTLEKVAVRLPNNDQLWLARVRLEIGAGDRAQAQFQLSRALQECPNSHLLWAENVALAPNRERKRLAKEALDRCENSEHLLLAVAKMFWSFRMFDKAREWFARAVKVEPLFGDAWAFWYRLECTVAQSGMELPGDEPADKNKRDVMDKCKIAEPRYGEVWAPIAKAVENWKLRTADLLQRAAIAVTIPE